MTGMAASQARARQGAQALAPVYDLLPMSLAPASSGALRPATALALGAPTRSAQSDAIGWAARLAEGFWLQVAASERSGSKDFKRLAQDNAAAVARHARAFANT